ncbi:threonine/serine exporter family protein [Paludicola sp. MB14-C6]|uniref:threonine/serine ThrE exporter family protein n=1 Tax=Paludihabitans sp. MB14-C6 TaxID=3070656 RepID=UPI0027DE2495|nr:threonine/serine exporter family protein [Paludicola sp. MB14-C6]WMJ22733.1 threonine/serine exporter family protein [Paludicola sp. MB14-C6]
MTNDQLLEISTEIGLSLLENGAEIYRVEESISRILSAYGVVNADVFAVPTCIITTIVLKDGQTHTRMKRIMNRSTNLDIVSAMNNLSRELCKLKPEYDEAKKLVNQAKNRKRFSLPIQILGCVFIGSFFTIFFGGNFYDALVSLLCCVVLKFLLVVMDKFKTNMFFSYTVGSMAIAAIAFLFHYLGFSQNMDKVIIGSLMNLVPGVALTNSMRDIIAGDLVAGLTKFVEAIMIAVAIAVGTGVCVYLLKMFV